jgi:hypothetical protein
MSMIVQIITHQMQWCMHLGSYCDQVCTQAGSIDRLPYGGAVVHICSYLCTSVQIQIAPGAGAAASRFYLADPDLSGRQWISMGAGARRRRQAHARWKNSDPRVYSMRLDS